MLSPKTTSETARPRVAFQGEHGAFSAEAAYNLLGDNIITVPCATFESLFSAVDEGRAGMILVPLENTLAGSVHRCYDLLRETSLRIAGEVVRPIAHCLIGCAGASVAGLRVVESHPVALAQCQRFLAAHPHIEYRAANDTAASVRRVVERGDPTIAAIAGQSAAQLYGGLILREGLADHAENYTRFVLLAPAPPLSDAADKVSLMFELRHEPGALWHALGTLAARHLDLLKIESRPIPGTPWQYRFYVDVRASVNDPKFSAACAELKKYATDLRLLGCYPAAARYSQPIAQSVQSVGSVQSVKAFAAEDVQSTRRVPLT